MFSVRIVTTDHYMSPPLPGLDVQYADLRGSEVKRVPVVRVFGSTPAGQKTCMHIHGVFPYLYVPYDGTAPWDRYLRQFAASLDKAINVAQGQGQSNQQHVFKINIVSGTAMYGYHDKDQQFLKIYMYNPQLIRKAADLLLGGAVMNKPFQPHESHIPYTLQLFIDYNLYGMNLINVAAVKFRRRLDNENEKQRRYRPVEILCSQGSDEGIGSDPKTPGSSTPSLLNRSSSLTPAVKYWEYENIPSEMFLDGDIERQSVCELEVDVVAPDILNRLEVNANVGANPGLAALWEDERQRRRERGEPTDNIAPPDSQEREGIEASESEQILRERLKQIMKDLQPYMDSQSDSEMDTSQDDYIPATQASQLDLHLSQDDIGGSQDTLHFDLDNSEDDILVNEDSVRQVVSRSESFCDRKPQLQKVSTQDRSLVDILAALAEDTDAPLSQQAVVDAVALEEHDSMLAQTCTPRDTEVDRLEEDEMLEMSQRIWEGDDRETDDNNDHNLEGMDDTWVDSQTDDSQTRGDKSVPAKGDNLPASDDDSDDDVIPQFDGPGDEKSTRREVKDMVTKRLGMRGPSYNMAGREMGMMQDPSGHYGQYGPAMGGGYGGYQGHQAAAMSAGPHRQYPSMMSGQQNPGWGGGQMYPQQQHPGGHMGHPQREFTMMQSSQTRMQHYPGSMQHSSMRMQQQSGAMHHPAASMSQSHMHQMQPGMGSMNHAQGNMQISPPTMNTYRDQQMSMYPGGNYPAYSQPDPGMKTHGDPHGVHKYGNKTMTSTSMGQSDYMSRYPGNMPYSSKQQYMSYEQSQHQMQANQGYSQQNQLRQSMYQQHGLSSQLHPSQQSMSTHGYAGSGLSHSQQMQGQSDRDFDSFCGIAQADVITPDSGGLKMSSMMSTSQQSTNFDSLVSTQSYMSHQGGTYSSMPERPSIDRPSMERPSLQPSSTSQSPRSSNQSPASDMARMSQPTGYLLKRPQSKGSFSSETAPLKGSSPGGFGLGDMDLYNSLDQPGLNKSPGLSGSGFVPNITPASPGNTYHIKKPVTKADASSYDSSLVQSAVHSSRLQGSGLDTLSDPVKLNKDSATFTSSANIEDGGHLFTQKKLCYEQISPPSTPSIERSQGHTKQLTSSPITAQPKADSQLSPLQKLLLEPTVDRGPAVKPSALQRSQSRNSVSSASSVTSDKGGSNQNMTGSQKSPNICSPITKSRPESLSDSRLYNLLANEGDMKNRPSDRLPKVSSSGKLNESQQDLFADSLLSPPNSGNLQDSAAGNDSFVSLFSDSFDSEQTTQSQKGNLPIGNQPVMNVAYGDKMRSDKLGETNKTDSLSTLESFVGSVTSDTDYGINFSKGGGGLQRENSVMSNMSNVSDQSFLSQLSNNDLSDLGSFTGQFQPFQGSQQLQPQGSTSYNMTSWPEHPPYQRKSSPKRLDGGPPRKRGRPPKSSLSAPGMSVIPALPGEKKRRGRPRKNSIPAGAAQQNATSPSQSMPNQFSPFQDTGGFMGVNPGQQVQQTGYQQPQQQQHMQQQDQFQQNQSFYGHQQMLQQQDNTMMSQSNTSQMQNYGTGFSNMQYQSFQSMSQNEGNFNQFFSSDGQQGQMQQQDFYGMQQQQQQQQQQIQQTQQVQPTTQQQIQPTQQTQQNYNQNFMTENFMQPSQELKQDSVSNQGPFLSQSQSNSNMSTIDASQLFHEEPLQDSLNLDTFDEEAKPTESMEKNSTELNQGQDFQFTTLQSMKHPNTLVQNFALQYLPGKSSLSELWKSPPVRPLPSPEYTFKFQVPIPFSKHSQTSDSSAESKPLPYMVRMHPKVARKYSLLKIGKEIIKLKSLTKEMIDSIKEQIKEGIIVESIPPPLRNLHKECTVPNSSIIANLLSCDSPLQEDVIESAFVESAIQKSNQGLNVENSTVVASKEDVKVSMQTDDLSTEVKDVKEESSVDNNSNTMVKHPKRPSENRERKRAMFKNKNIANIPHRKKYRAGFSYFGKGNIGRGGSVKVRQNHPVLGPEFEDDSNIVLKDVSLNDGVLTPIKSRTPIAGRSPAHSCGPTACELESQDKEELDTKLKSLYDLELNQPQNPEMFNDSEMFVGEDEENSEDEESDESGGDDVDGGQEDEKLAGYTDDTTENKENVNTDGIHSQATVPSDVRVTTQNTTENKENVNKDDVNPQSKESSDVKVVTKDITDKENVNAVVTQNQSVTFSESKIPTKLDQDALPGNENKISSGITVENSKLDKVTSGEDNLEVKMKTDTGNKAVENSSKGIDVPGEADVKMLDTEKSKNEDQDNIARNQESEDTQISKDGVRNQTSKVENESEDKNQVTVFYGKFKSHFKEKFAQLKNNENTETADKDISGVPTTDQCDIDRSRVTRSRSSSCDSKEAGSLCGSRRSSAAALSAESALLSSESSSVKSCRQDPESKKKVKRKTKKANSVSSGSRKSSRSSSVDKDVKKKSGKISRRKPYNVDSDSDGIPGVDYIVTGKFKGYKEMKVKVDKMDINCDKEVVKVQDHVTKDKEDRNHLNYSKETKLATGFSAEFEKFLASQSHQPATCSRTSSSDSQQSDNVQMNESEKSKKDNNENVKSEIKCKSSGISESVNKASDSVKQTEDSDQLTTKSDVETLTVKCSNKDEDSGACNKEKESSLSEEKLRNKETSGQELNLSDCNENINKPNEAMEKSNHEMNNKHISFSLSENAESKQIKELTSKENSYNDNGQNDDNHQQNLEVENPQCDNDTKPNILSTVNGEDQMEVDDNSSAEQEKVGECKFDSSSSCVDACDSSTVKVGNSTLISTTGPKPSSSSSEDESEKSTQPRKKPVKNNSPKKKKRNSHRLANAFCGSKARKKRNQKRRPSKWMTTLNALHDATMEKLTANKVYGGDNVVGQVQVTTNNDTDTRVDNTSMLTVVPPDFEVYCDRATDYDDDYSDTMFRLAYYSPPSSENGNNSSPQPLSPEEMKQMTVESDNKPEVLIEHREKKMTLADVMKSVRQSDEDSLEHSRSNLESDMSDDNVYKSPSKTAIAHEAPLTLKDIKSLCLEKEEQDKKLEQEEQAKKIDLSSPPDLGPPVIPKYLENEITEDHNIPPNLTPNRQISNDSSRSDVESYTNTGNDAARPNYPELYDDRYRSVPPFLTPCRSPRIPQSPRGSPRVLPVLEHKSDMSGYFSLGSDVETECKVKPGKSPGASSTGSINVIHSEQFSDISEDEESDTCPDITSQHMDMSPIITSRHIDMSPIIEKQPADMLPVLDKQYIDTNMSPTKQHMDMETSPIIATQNMDRSPIIVKQNHSAVYIDRKHHSNSQNSEDETSPIIAKQNYNAINTDRNHYGNTQEGDSDHSRKLKEIREFEARLERSDFNRNNIFDVLNSQGRKFEVNDLKLSKPKCNSKEEFVKNVELLMNKNHSAKDCIDNVRDNGMLDSYMATYSGFGVNNINNSVRYNHSVIQSQDHFATFQQKPRNCSFNEAAVTKFSLESDNVLKSQSQHGVVKSHSQHDSRRGLFDSVGMGHEFWMDNKDARVTNGYKSFNSRIEHADNPLNALIDMHKSHFSPNWNSFQTPNSFHSNSDRNDKSNTDKQSLDLFDPSSERNCQLSTLSQRHQPVYNRSLSEPSKYDLSIVSNRRLSDSIIKSVENMKEKAQVYQRSHSVEHSVEHSIENLMHSPPSDKGGRKSKSAKKPVSDSSQTSRDNKSLDNASNKTDKPDNDNEDIEGNNNKNPKRRKLMEAESACNVITPLQPPPSRGIIQQTHGEMGLMSVQHTPAFYSNHRDLPTKPREGGGQVLKVNSALVKDLDDFSHTANSITGVKGWRSLFCMNNDVFMSQSDANCNINEQLDKQPQLKYALTGDRPVVVCPFDAPPTSKQVQTWWKGKKLYKDLKIQALQKEKKGDKDIVLKESTAETEKDTKTADITPKSSHGENGTKTKKGDKLRLNLFTGKRELCADEGSSSSPSQSGSESRHKHDGSYVEGPEEGPVVDSPTRDAQIQSQLTGVTKDEADLATGSPLTGLHKHDHGDHGDDDDILHSTPLRRQSTELFEPECTPIVQERKRPDLEDKDQFVTPKRIKSVRSRRSSASGRGLLQATMNTQLKRQFVTPQSLQKEASQIEGPSLKNSFGFKLSQQNYQSAKTLHEFQHLTVLSVEVHAESRGDLRPDPEVDAIQAIFYSIFNDVPPEKGTRFETGVFICDPESANHTDLDKSSTNQDKDKSTNQDSSTKAGPSSVKPSQNCIKTLLQKSAVYGLNVLFFKTEMDMLKQFKEFITEWDPDILVGYEIQMLSWGYILQRASVLSYNLTQAISRVPSFKQSSHHSAERDEWGADHHSEIHIAGRIVLNLWRILRHEVTLNIYSFENVAFHVLHRRIPLYTHRSLTSWFKHRTHHHRWKVIHHYVTRVKCILDIMDKLDLVGRTSEFARVFGIEFYHVLSRGSQYRVESMMLRVAKPLNYIPVSPSVHQRARMKAPECIPLTLEPESRFYTDPVIVLDFQSLYPSIMIAYNYCFSTCLGRLEWFQNVSDGPIEFGCTSLNLTASMIKNIEKDVTISPNGIVFCKQSVKRGVLPVMVEEILNTRLMVKKAMGSYKDDKTLSRLLNARQLGLKLIANVTYGYTGANFSGRMPCIEVGDSIVRKARETLERSIKLVEETPKWGAKVIYGDTDSMFLLLKGCSKDEAFKIGQDIAKTVTKMFPKPIKLKFEKVYLPCVLQTKKRYCGFMYETPDQKEPVYDAKGIETVRRDSCSAVSKMLERSIKILFTSKDVSQVKSYVQQQCKKIMEGTVSLQDYIFAKEYRGIPGYKPGACVPALELSKKLLRQDRRSEPRVGERVPYVIVYGSPGLPLIQLVRQPMEVLQDHSLRLNSVYYITKQILPPLDRFLSLLGVDVVSWYHDMPHSAGRVTTQFGVTAHNKKGTISQYFATSNCPLCDEMTKQPVCHKCMKNPQLVCITLNEKISQWERVHTHLEQICRTCTGSQDVNTGRACISLDCPILYRKSRANADMDKVTAYRGIMEKVFKT